MQTPTPKRRPLRFIILGAVVVFVGLALWVRSSEKLALQRASASFVSEPVTRPPAEVTSALRAMKLVTVEIDTLVRVERGDTSWRGDVLASVEVPVRLHFGVDLSTLRADSVAKSPVPGVGYTVRIPRPTRLSAEIFTDREKHHVEAGWMRLRSQAGEYHLSQARKDAPMEARRLTLLPGDAARVEQVTREQVERLVRSVVGESVPVRIIFEDGP